ncbi:MAG: single-stranded DNA-binding protein [Betaproteobacteria bacterium]|nr:MAG: single-stranded DNA-binding protein [Betaproteobacteria bacterium]
MAARSGLVPIARRLRDDVSALRFEGLVAHVYNPLTYAWAPHHEYLERYGRGRRDVLIVGMNAGYFGMVQTGVPFGDVEMVRDWLVIQQAVKRPNDEHPRRPIEGFSCRRHEVSGQRLWGWARDRFETPLRFFAHFFVLNYCPLCFLAQGGANLALDKLPVAARRRLFIACDRAIDMAADTLNIRYAVGLGRFATERVAAILGGKAICGGAPHPSPANARVGRNWANEMDRALAEMGIRVPN